MRIKKLSQDMSHLRKRSETTLGCMTADRAVADARTSMPVSHQPRAGNGLDAWQAGYG